MSYKNVTILTLTLCAFLLGCEGQCNTRSGCGGGSVRYSSQPQYESTVTRHESQPVYFYPDQQIYSHSPPSQSQVRYSSSSYQPSYQTTHYEPAVSYNRRIISESYPTYSQGTRYYTQPEVVYRQQSPTTYYTSGGCSGGGSGRVGRC